MAVLTIAAVGITLLESWRTMEALDAIVLLIVSFSDFVTQIHLFVRVVLRVLHKTWHSGGVPGTVPTCTVPYKVVYQTLVILGYPVMSARMFDTMLSRVTS